jgi:hypothetical protein
MRPMIMMIVESHDDNENLLDIGTHPSSRA